MVASQATFIPLGCKWQPNDYSGSQQALIKSEERLINLENIVVLICDEVFNYDIEFVAMRQRKAGFH